MDPKKHPLKDLPRGTKITYENHYEVKFEVLEGVFLEPIVADNGYWAKILNGNGKLEIIRAEHIYQKE